MQKIIMGILAVMFLGLLYLNFGVTTKSQIIKPLASEKMRVEKDNEETLIEEKTEEPSLIFKDEKLNQTYQTLIERNEPLVISLLLPSYYSEDFIKGLKSKFDTDTVQLERLDIDGNTVTLDSLSAFKNSDVIILSALQVQDYTDEILEDHNLNRILEYYTSFYKTGMTAIILSDPNVFQHNNLENVISTDQSYMSANDFYYVSNIETEADAMYDLENGVFTPEVENQIQNNIKTFLVK